MLQEIPLEQITRKGAMTKSPMDMSTDEFAAWQRQIQIDAREYLYSIGQPYVIRQNGKIVAEYADGRVQTVR
jgi:hypothetical protein